MTSLQTFSCYACVLLATLLQPFPQSSTAQTRGLRPEPAAGRLLVKLTGAATARVDDAIRQSAPMATGLPSFDLLTRATGVRGIRRALPSLGDVDADGAVGLARWYVVDLPIGADVREIAEQFARDASVEEALPSYPLTPLAVPNDPYYADAWGHNNTGQMQAYADTCPAGCGNDGSHCAENIGTVGFDTGIEAAWDEPQGYGDPSIVIAIPDFGFDTDHPDLRYVAGYDFREDDDDPDASGSAHGTNCAGVAAGIADNGIGIAGAAGGCSIMPLRILFAEDFAEAITFATANGANIMSMSIALVGVTEYALVDDALTAASAAGLVLFAASGNADDSLLWVPATHPDVITVGAVDPCGNRKTKTGCDGESWWGSSWGGTTPDSAGTIDLVAPTITPSTDNLGADGDSPDDYCFYFTGTSCAAPYAAGMAALILSANPTWTPAQVRQRMVDTAIDIVNAESGVGWDPYTGHGLVSGAALVGPVSVPQPSPGHLLSLSVHPNPFRGSVAVTFAVPNGIPYTLSVYDVSGRRVRNLHGTPGGTGGVVEWDGRSAAGTPLSGGTYFIRLSAAGQTVTRKFVRLEE